MFHPSPNGVQSYIGRQEKEGDLPPLHLLANQISLAADMASTYSVVPSEVGIRVIRVVDFELWVSPGPCLTVA